MAQAVTQVLSTESGAAIDDIFRCFICLGRVVDAKLCPSCSKMCCSACIIKWLTENRAICPHCRRPLQPDHLVNGRFVAEISQALEKLQVAEPIDKCQVHETPLNYYCVTCQTLVCSDCAMFESQHKGHEFQRLNAIYDKQAAEVKKEAETLKEKLKDLMSVLGQVERNLEEVQKGKAAKAQEIGTYFEDLQKNLDETLREKVKQLLEQKETITSEIERLEGIQLELTRFLNGPKAKLISKTTDLLHKLKSATELPISNFRFSEVNSDFQSELEPPYESGLFFLQSFSQVRKKTEVVYSDQLFTHGLTWRLKVYPNGNGLSQGTHLSVFLEMMKGGGESTKYEYKVELLHTKDASRNVIREFSSEFESGECWGYNRFFALDNLETLGYLDAEQDTLAFRFMVRPPTWQQLYLDQLRYIQLLESEQRDLSQETELLQDRLQTYEKPKIILQSNENPLSSLDHEESKSAADLSWEQAEEGKSDKEDEGCVRLAGLSLMKKFMMTPGEVSVSSASPRSSRDSEEYPCFVWASREHRSRTNSESPSPGPQPHATSHLDSPPRSL